MNEQRNKPLNVLLFELGILLIPYDAMHVMPSTYAPISLYAFLFSLISSLSQKRGKLYVNKCAKQVLIAFAYMSVSSLFTAMIYVKSYKFYLNFLVTFTLGFVTYFCTINIQQYYRNRYSQADFFDRILDLICRAYYIPLLVGFVELAAMKGILPYNIKLSLNAFFGGWQSRLCMTNHEASWASMHMLILIAASFVMYKKIKKRKYLLELLCGVFFFFVLASAQGLLTLVLAMVLYLLLSSIYKSNIVHFIKQCLVVMVIVALFGFIFYKVLLLNPSSYYASRILYFTSLQSLLATDSSTFIRIGYLILHLLIFKDHWIMGIGGGSFNYVFAEYAMRYFPKSTRLAEVAAHISMKDASTTVSTYFSVFSEFGVVGVILFYYFFIHSIKNVKFLQIKNTENILIFFAVCLALPIQFGSWAFVPWWFVMAILSEIGRYNCDEHGVENDYEENSNCDS